jgi:hypothetical protein
MLAGGWGRQLGVRDGVYWGGAHMKNRDDSHTQKSTKAWARFKREDCQDTRRYGNAHTHAAARGSRPYSSSIECMRTGTAGVLLCVCCQTRGWGDLDGSYRTSPHWAGTFPVRYACYTRAK